MLFFFEMQGLYKPHKHPFLGFHIHMRSPSMFAQVTDSSSTDSGVRSPEMACLALRHTRLQVSNGANGEMGGRLAQGEKVSLEIWGEKNEEGLSFKTRKTKHSNKGAKQYNWKLAI